MIALRIAALLQVADGLGVDGQENILTGIADGTIGSVKFVFETGAIASNR